MYGLESLIRLTVVCVMAAVALPSMQAQVRARAEQAMTQLEVFQDLPSYDEHKPLPTVYVSDAVRAQLLSSSSP